jgi:PAS domain S-box-containing protein
MRSAKSKLVTFGIALAAAGLAVALQWMTRPILGELTPYIFLFPVTVLIASRYGLGGGIQTAAIGMAATEILLLASSKTPPGWSGAALRMTMLLLTAVYSGLLTTRLHRSQRRFRWLFESNIISIAFWDVNGEIWDANEAFCRLLGITSKQLKARQVNWQKVTPPELLARDFQAIEEIKERGFNEPYEKIFIHRDGHRVPVLTAGGMLAGSSCDGVAFFVDLSKQKQVEESLRKISEEMEKARQAAKEANQAKSLFLATMSHEIRTPLNAIMGFAQLLVGRDLPEKDREDFAERIERNGQVLAHLIDDILDLSKIEAGKLALEKVEMNLQKAIADVAAVMEHKAREKGILFSMATVDPVPESIRSDPTRFKQILTNIIGNAIKFTDHGEVRVSIHADPTLKKLQVTVRDTGIGLTSAQAASLFQPFSQAKVSTARQFGGTGLGLVLARRLAQALGGDVKLIESRPGEGSTFEITITSEGAKYHVRPIPPVKIKEEDETRLDGLRILLAEDVPDNQLLATRLLTMAGAKVDIANDGQEAIDKASVSPYDVILMDMRMPHLDGIEATTRLRRQGYQAPIVALTAHALRDEVDRSLAAGCNAHLAKPIRRDELVQVIRRSIGLPAGDAMRP